MTTTDPITSTLSISSPPQQQQPQEPLHIVVIVLGDVGRSPRMQYHALSLVQDGHTVTLVGYDGEALIEELQHYQEQTNGNLQPKAGGTLHVVRFTVPAVPTWLTLGGRNRLLYFVWRIVFLTVWTWWTLVNCIPNNTVDAVLVQNPPALPLLAVAWLYCRYCHYLTRQPKRPALIIDWHNLGYSMLPTTGGLLQRVGRWYERLLGPTADAHMTVTTALRRFLQDDFLLRQPRRRQQQQPQQLLIAEVPDCPPAMFRPRHVADQHELLQRLQLEQACPKTWWSHLDIPNTQTLWTEQVVGRQNETILRHRKGRPALVTSSTSWTADEDFGILLQALVQLDDKISNADDDDNNTLKVVVVVTGKGPQKSMYEEQISRLTLRHVAITTVWLEPGDYPRLLAAADVGVSLHTSTSGLDLPMKVLDLFGCEVPVCAMQFACLDELVQDGVNGRVFTDSATLADILWELLRPLGDTSAGSNNKNKNDGGGLANHAFGALAEYSTALQNRPRWNDNWHAHAWPLLEQVTRGRS